MIASLECPPGLYARTLLDVLELKSHLRAGAVMPAMRAAEMTSKRVEYNMNESGRSPSQPSKVYWMAAVILALLVLPGGSLLIGSRQNQQPGQPVVSNREATLRAEARAAMNAKDWKRAAAAFRKVIQVAPDQAQAWFLLGYALHADGKLDEAIPAHLRATEFPSTRTLALYNLACAYSLKNEKEKALDYLRQSIDAGFHSPRGIREDADFANVRDDPRFQELEEAAKPPAQRAVYRQFDFWVGNWNVLGRDGRQVGVNVITKDEMGFLLTEKWTNANGGTGTSINYYDPSEKKWKQTWVDAAGNVIKYAGGMKDGQMQMQGDCILASGRKLLSRVKFTPNADGTVHQFIERSEDGGQTWSVYFDGTYVRQESAAEPEGGAAATGCPSNILCAEGRLIGVVRGNPAG